MKRSRRRSQEPLLFDLPLEEEPVQAEHGSQAGVAVEAEEPAGPAEPLPLFLPEVEERGRGSGPPEPQVREALPAEVERKGPEPARPGARLLADAADLLVHAAALVAALVGTRLLGVEIALSQLPALALLLLAFSFLYTVIPLAFWGQTPGMAWVGLVARSAVPGKPLEVRSAVWRWVGMVLTVAMGGLPWLLTLAGSSLADRLSGSRTLPRG